MLHANKYRIYPTDDQKVLLAKTFGCCRFVYNWALNLKKTAYEERKETLGNVYLTNLMKSELKTEFEWLSEVNSQSLQSSLRNLDTAYANFFRVKEEQAELSVSATLQCGFRKRNNHHTESKRHSCCATPQVQWYG